MEKLSETDLIIDQVYQGGRFGNAKDDPLPALLGVDSGAGFRHLGSRPSIKTLKLLVLKSSFNDPDWPDAIDTSTGLLTYYGDNKKVAEIHDTPRQGNKILRNLFEARHSKEDFDHFPAILVFGPGGKYRDVRFLGLAVPGADGVGADDDLVAIWRAKGPDNERFQNYKSKFTILDVPVISRAWIKDIADGRAVQSPHAPKAWLKWLSARKYTPLAAPHTLDIRSKEQQLPRKKSEIKTLEMIYNHFKEDPYAFEQCAIELARMMMPNISEWELTRPWRDGGRDATGLYTIGTGQSSVSVEFALEAKCYKPGSGVGVKELSRLLSRLRHRQFGVLVTTSYLSRQAYTELKEDQHPVVVISGADMVSILRARSYSDVQVRQWLEYM